jgi:hypothetical protein
MVGRAPQPLRIHDGFWAREDVYQVLTGRDFGSLFRLLAKYVGASQTQIAIAVGMTQGQVSKIMAGDRRVTAIEVVERVFDGLSAPDQARMAFGLAPRGAVAGGGVDHVTVPEPQRADTGSSVRSEAATEDGVDRRDVLRLGGAALHVTFGRHVDLAASLLGSRHSTAEDTPVDLPRLTKQAQDAWRLRQRADYDALGRLLPELLGKAESGLSSADDAGRQQLSRILVHAYNAASSLLKKLGNEAFALLAADRATRTARQLGDSVLTAAAMYRLANVLLAARRLEQAQAVALEAADLTEPGKVQTPRSLAMWGGLLLTAAVAAARRGAESDAWELMGEARAGSRLLGTDHADIYSIFGPTNVAIHGVQVAVELRNGADAIRRAAQVDADRLPPSLIERRGQYLIDLAHGYVLQRNDEEAVAALLRADAIAPQEVRLSHEVQSLTRTMLSRERAGAAPGLRDLAARVDVLD